LARRGEGGIARAAKGATRGIDALQRTRSPCAPRAGVGRASLGEIAAYALTITVVVIARNLQGAKTICRSA